MKIAKEKIKELIMEEINTELKEASMGILEEQYDPQLAQMIQKIAEMLQNMQGILQQHERKIQQLHKELRDVQRRR